MPLNALLGQIYNPMRRFIERPQTRFFTPQQMVVRASPEATFAAMTAFTGSEPGCGCGPAEILQRHGNRYVVRFTTPVRAKRYITKEEVTVYEPDVVTYYHLEGPFAYVYEVFTARQQAPDRTLVNYIGQYRLKRYDLPLIGWLIHRLIVLPRYDAVIARHLAEVRGLAERALRRDKLRWTGSMTVRGGCMDPRRLRSELLNGTSGDLCRRRAVVALSLVGVASMAATSLLQMGLIRHLPDPPFAAFDSDKVNLSTEAYKFGAPDGTLGLASYAANLPLAAFGGAGRARTMPWLPLLAAAKAAADAAVAVWYFYQMPAKEKAWCAYCLVAQGATLGVLALTLPEARRALAALRP